MKVAFMINDLSSGGAEHATCSIAGYLADNNIDTTIVTVNNCEPFYKINDKVRVVSLESKDIEKSIGIKRMFSTLFKSFDMRKQIKNMGFDIIVGMSNIMAYYLIFCTAFTKTKCIGTERSDPRHHMNTPIHRVLRKLAGKFSDGYIFLAKEHQSYFPTPKCGFSAVIPNAVYNEYAYDIKFPEKRDKTITAMGRLHDVKAYDVMIKAFDKFHIKNDDYTLEIFGEGEEENNLKALIKSLEAEEYIKIIEPVEDAIIRVANSSVFLLTSKYEGMSNSLLESLFCAVPCISTNNSPTTRDLITNNENGIIVDIGDIDQIADSLDKIVNDNEFSETLSNNAYDSTRKYSIDNIGKMWIDYFKKII